MVYFEQFTFFDQSEAFKRLALAFVTGTLTMIFYAVVSLTLAVIFRQTIKTWIIAAVFLVCTNLMVQVDMGSDWLNRWFFPKLTNTWQEFFVTEINWERILLRSMALIIYIIATSAVGLWIFKSLEIG